MGQQQLLLVIIGVIIVGVAVAIAITMFHDNAINSNRDVLKNDLLGFAGRAQQYYRKTAANGGGGNSFTNITIANVTNMTVNDNGTYSILTVEPQQIVMVGRGTHVVGTDTVEVRCTVTPFTVTVTTEH